MPKSRPNTYGKDKAVGDFTTNTKGASIIEGRQTRSGDGHLAGGKPHRADSRRQLGMKNPLDVKDWTD